MIVVSDTSCISNLLSVGQELLLPRLFREVLIPPAVEWELMRFHASLPEFLKRVAPTDESRIWRLRQELDLGEAEAISLAWEVKADRLLIDEAIGRAVALREGLPIIGLVGVLVSAKRCGFLRSRPVVRSWEVVKMTGVLVSTS
jgi:uncharacterized protein